MAPNNQNVSLQPIVRINDKNERVTRRFEAQFIMVARPIARPHTTSG